MKAMVLAAALLFGSPRDAGAQPQRGRSPKPQQRSQKEASEPQGRADSAVPYNGETLTLAIGETRTISAKDVRNYSEGASGVVEIKLTTDASQFVINGRRAGSTTLLLIKSDGAQVTLTIDVFAHSPEVVERELTQLLDGLPNLQMRRVGAHIVIDGAVANEADLRRVQRVAALYPDEVDSLVSIAGAGEARTPKAQRRVIIRIDFYFVQYDSNSSYGVGIGWPAFIGGPAVEGAFTYDFLAGATREATATLSNQPLPTLDIASVRGWAKVLKQATVITDDGVEAVFSNGGEQNFSITTGLGVGVQRIPFGTQLTVLPKFDSAEGEVNVKISADVSDLTAAVSGTPLPGRNTSKLTTDVSLKLGQSLVLSGIRRESTTHTITGIPFLKDIPVLGLLFGSHADLQQATEGAIFVVPSVVEEVPPSAQELVSSALATFRRFTGDVRAVKAFDHTPGGAGALPHQPH